MKVHLFGFFIAWVIVEGRRNGDMEEGSQDALLDKVLAKSAANLNAALVVMSWVLLLLT